MPTLEVFHDYGNGGDMTVVNEEGDHFRTDAETVDAALRAYWSDEDRQPDDLNMPATVRISPTTVLR